MPFYEYQCKNCGHELEAMQRVSDAPLKKCPHCGKSQLERLMSAPVFRLKGGGWYETDFKDEKDKKRNLADRADGDTPKDAENKGESKADPAADASKTKEKPVEKQTEKQSKDKSATKKATPSRRPRSKKTIKRPANR